MIRHWAFPTYWTALRTSNPVERLNKEFKRRTKAMKAMDGEILTYRCLAYVAQLRFSGHRGMLPQQLRKLAHKCRAGEQKVTASLTCC